MLRQAPSRWKKSTTQTLLNFGSNLVMWIQTPEKYTLFEEGGAIKEFAERLLEKATRLVGKSVYVVTSQTTKMWPTTEWLCDIEPIIETATKASFAKKVTAQMARQI